MKRSYDVALSASATSSTAAPEVTRPPENSATIVFRSSYLCQIMWGWAIETLNIFLRICRNFYRDFKTNRRLRIDLYFNSLWHILEERRNNWAVVRRMRKELNCVLYTLNDQWSVDYGNAIRLQAHWKRRIFLTRRQMRRTDNDEMWQGLLREAQDSINDEGDSN